MFGADMKMPYSLTIRSKENRGLVDWDYWDISFNYVFCHYSYHKYGL